MTKRTKRLLLSVFALCFLIGCGNEHVAVKGRAVFSEDGSPLPMGTVYLSTPTFQATGPIDKNGYFTIGSDKPGNGLPPGTYQVSVVGVYGAVEGSSAHHFPNYPLIDMKWSNPDTSGLSLDVSKSVSNWELKVDRNPLPPPKIKPGTVPASQLRSR